MWTNRRSGFEKQRSPTDHRNPYERDRTRLIHSAAFRRLQRKTQIFSVHEGDFHRTRLTHSLEVDSIARSLVKNLQHQIRESEIDPQLLDILPTDDLVSAIALSHDIGHPPFGHGGESALNYMMREYGGFESNGQTLRLLTKLETSYQPYGLDLTRRTLLGILKYPVAYSVLAKKTEKVAVLSTASSTMNVNHWVPQKCYLDEEQAEIGWILEPLSVFDRTYFQSYSNQKTIYHSLDCSIMNIADDIAYGIHDLEDAIHLKLITRDHLPLSKLSVLFSEAFPQGTWSLLNAQALLDKLFHPNTAKRKEAIGDLVNSFITAVCLKITHENFAEPLLRYNAILPDNIENLLIYFKTVVFDHVINSPDSRITEHGGQQVVCGLFNTLSSNPEQLLSFMYRKNYEQATSKKARARVICDYIASMTDEYAYQVYKRLSGIC